MFLLESASIFLKVIKYTLLLIYPIYSRGSLSGTHLLYSFPWTLVKFQVGKGATMGFKEFLE